MASMICSRAKTLNAVGRFLVIRKMKDAPLDLELLRFFAALMDTGALNRAAIRLELSQPAASRALQRLRELFHDKLFVKSGLGMAPTPRALALRPAVDEALAKLEALILAESFDPARTTRRFRIAMMDNALLIAMRSVLPEFLRQAPRAALEIVPVETDIAEQLRDGRADLVVFTRPALPPDCHAHVLVESDYVCLMRKSHPLLAVTPTGTAPTLEAFRRYPRISIKARWGPTVRAIDQSAMPALEECEPAITTPYFLGAPLLLTETELILVVPRPTAEQFCRMQPLAFLPTPIPSALFRPQLVWHDRVHADGAVKWLRELIIDAARKL